MDSTSEVESIFLLFRISLFAYSYMCEIDVRVGGHWRYAVRAANGDEYGFPKRK